MATISVTSTPVVLLVKNINRVNAVLQNTGANDVFVKKWLYTNPIAPVPSPTNYDFILTAKPGEGNSESDIYQFTNVSGYVGVTASGKTSSVGASETVKVVL